MYLRIYLTLGRARKGNTRTEKRDDKVKVVNSNMANFKFFNFFYHTTLSVNGHILKNICWFTNLSRDSESTLDFTPEYVICRIFLIYEFFDNNWGVSPFKPTILYLSKRGSIPVKRTKNFKP